MVGRTRQAVDFGFDESLLRTLHGFAGVVSKFVNPVIADVISEILRGNVFEFMSFVEDYGAVIRKNSRYVFSADVQVGEKEMMVDDDNVRFQCLLAHECQKTPVVVLAFGAKTLLATSVDSRP